MNASFLERYRGAATGTMEDSAGKKKKRKLEDGNDDKARSLSELPEHILQLILLFLSTKEAIQTSLLSKKWEYIWTSIPKLHFDRYQTELLMDFVNIVDRALRLRGPFDLTSFHINCDTLDFHREEVDMIVQIEAWISAVVRFNVQDVKLSLFGYGYLNLPFNFVNYRTLTHLAIFAQGGIIFKFPSPVCFSNLKKLTLSGITFPDGHLTQPLFSGCPLLEDLELKQCDWEGEEAVSVVFPPRLQKFSMIEDDEFPVTNFHGDGFVISGDDLSVINHFLKLLRCSSNAQRLTLMNSMCLLEIQEVMDRLPVFNRLRHLALDYETSDLSSQGLLMMLRNTPFLRSLVFPQELRCCLIQLRITCGILCLHISYTAYISFTYS